jgi:hypothetical protein
MTNEEKVERIADDIEQAVDDGIQQAVTKILYEAENLTPVVTGNLLRHWKISETTVYNDCEYADFAIPNIFEDINAEQILADEVEKELERKLK